MTSPFGKYASIVAAVVALLIVLAWLASLLGVAGLVPNDGLTTAALLVIGVIFGTGAGAAVVASSAGTKADAANARLDAISAPAASSVQVTTGPVDNGALDGAGH